MYFFRHKNICQLVYTTEVLALLHRKQVNNI